MDDISVEPVTVSVQVLNSDNRVARIDAWAIHTAKNIATLWDHSYGVIHNAVLAVFLRLYPDDSPVCCVKGNELVPVIGIGPSDCNARNDKPLPPGIIDYCVRKLNTVKVRGVWYFVGLVFREKQENVSAGFSRGRRNVKSKGEQGEKKDYFFHGFGLSLIIYVFGFLRLQNGSFAG